MSIAQLRFDTLILCDDVRLELSGKVILIGVYATDLATPKFPAQFAFAVHTQGTVLRQGSVDLQFTIEDELGGTLYRSTDVLPPIIPSEARFVEGRFAVNFLATFTVHKVTTISFVAHIGGEQHIITKRKIGLISSTLQE